MVPIFQLVHPVDTEQHPTYPKGHWRWAVMVGEGPFSDTQRCANAGLCPTKEEALEHADRHAATAAVAARLAAAQVAVQLFGGETRPVVELDHDPIPAEADHEPLRQA